MNKDEMAELELLREKNAKLEARTKRGWVKQLLFAQKARAAGITVSESEIDEYVKKRSSK